MGWNTAPCSVVAETLYLRQQLRGSEDLINTAKFSGAGCCSAARLCSNRHIHQEAGYSSKLHSHSARDYSVHSSRLQCETVKRRAVVPYLCIISYCTASVLVQRMFVQIKPELLRSLRRSTETTTVCVCVCVFHYHFLLCPINMQRLDKKIWSPLMR